MLPQSFGADADGLVNPVGNKYVRFPRFCRIPVRGKDELFAIRTEHGEAIKSRIQCDLLLTFSIHTDDVKIKISSGRILHIGGEDDSLAVWMKIGTEVGGGVVCHLPDVRSIRVHDVNFQLAWFYQMLLQKLLIFCKLVGCRNVVTPKNDFF